MIGALTGKVLFIQPDRVVLDVSGVGYEVFLSTESLAKLPEKGNHLFLHIHTQVREDAITLFGFMEEEEKEMFLILKTVSGIGPKLALGILSGMQIGDLSRAIAEGDVKLLTTLQGIGKKTAERICVELKDKVGEIGDVSSLQSTGGVVVATNSNVADTLSALVNLGYPDPVARQALSEVKKRNGDETFMEMGVQDLIREALRALA